MYPRSFRRLAKVSGGVSLDSCTPMSHVPRHLGRPQRPLSGSMAWSAVNDELWRSADVKACPANTALRFICLLKAAGRPARAVGFLRRSLPDDILDLPADLFD